MAAVPADPWTSGLMALGGVASGAVNDKTAMTNQAGITTTVDNSGWAVNISGGNGTQTASSEKAAPVAAVAAAANSLLKNPMVLLLIAVGLYAVLKK